MEEHPEGVLTLSVIEETSDMGDLVRDSLDELLARRIVVVFGSEHSLKTLEDALGDRGIF